MVALQAEGFGLQHEIFVLDTYLTKSLPSHKYRIVTMQLVQNLLDALGMAELGKLQIYPAVDLRAPGWSFIQPITTSHIAGHYFEKPGRLPHLRLDIYSCKTVNWKTVIEVLHEEISLADWRATFIHRGIESIDERPIVEITGEGTSVHEEEVLSMSRPRKSLPELPKIELKDPEEFIETVV